MNRIPKCRRRGRAVAQHLVAAVVVTALAVPVHPATAQDVDLDRIDRYIDDLMDDWTTPGLAVAIVKDDRVVFARGYGVRRLGEDAPVDERTLFAVASNTKAFTVSALGLLVEEALLAWDDRVTDHLEWFAMSDPWVTRDIRVRDLLTHRSGLPTYGGDRLWIGSTLGRDEIIRRIRYMGLESPFRTRFHYQNLMYLTAGQLLPAITGTSWDDMVRTRLLEPLGMSETNTTVRALAGQSNVASPHEVVGGVLQPIEYDNLDGVAPAAAINSNVMDMARWMRLHIAGGKYEGREILAPETVRAMQSVQFPLGVSTWSAENFDQNYAGIGLGWFLRDYKGRNVVSHSGGMSGMISLQTLIPEESLGVVVLTNFAPDAPTRAITNYILDAYLGEPERDWNAVYTELRGDGLERAARREAEIVASRVPDTSPSLPLEAYAGTYFEPVSGDAVVRVEDGHLVFDYNPRFLGDIEHWTFDTFRVTWRHSLYDVPPRSFVEFEINPDGAVRALTIRFYHETRFERIPG